MLIEHELPARSLLKSVSYRLAGTILSTGIAFVVTGRWAAALAIGGLEAVSKTALYYLHERAWSRIAFGRRHVTPAVVWFTGLSGAGKSALADALAERLRAQRLKVERLDGDMLRALFPETSFTKEARDGHVRRTGLLASCLERQGVVVIVSMISPYADARNFARGLCQNFIEVYVSTPLAVCEQRDPKGLYARARRGEIKDFTGVDSPYEPPESPEIEVDSSELGFEESLEKVLRAVEARIG